ncbi:MAG TPA: hypothetical protein VFB12_15050 [Ktedonobacteraceae bacterium]|nr:hypothetical protein [Ktedonobacteraceae bacterium]
MGNVYETTLYLTEPEHFFRKPDISPFSPDYREYSYTSGIEYLANELYAHPSSREVRVTLLLPTEQVVPDLQQTIQEAVKRYCRGRIKEIEQQRRGLRQRALQGLLMTLVGMVVFIALGSELTFNASVSLRMLGEVAIVIGWVYVWFPLDALVFGVRHYHLDSNIYKKLMAMQLTLKHADDDGIQ